MGFFANFLGCYTGRACSGEESKMTVSSEKARHAAAVWRGMVVLILFVEFCITIEGSAAGDRVPTFTRDVAPILFKNCLRCHSSEGIASSVPLTSYDAVRPRAVKIQQKVITREMPPWPADPAKSLRFRNDARLSQKDINTIVAWVRGGAPKGDDADLPAIPKSEEGWMHPQGLKPDLVISLPGDVHVPARGEIPYVSLLVKVPLSEDRWITASQTRPSNAAVVHHMALTEVALPDGLSPADLDQAARQMGIANGLFAARPAVTTPSMPDQIDMLGIYTPGSTVEVYGDGSAKLLRGGKNMYLDFNIHYEADGRPDTDRSSIAFWFQPGPPDHQLFRVNGAGETVLANGKELLTDARGTKAEGTNVVIPAIPPFAEHYELVGVTGYPKAVTIYQFQPHAHHRGKDFTYSVVYPNGREQTLLSVPKYDHRWQIAYELETPLKLPAGSKIVVTAHYDNSKMNMHNPGPEKQVYFRDQNQSWDEMFTPFIQYSIDSQNPAELPTKSASQSQHEKTSTSVQQRSTDKGSLQTGEVVGCLVAAPSGNWLVTKASQPVVSDAQATTSIALKVAEEKPLGNQRYQLLGVRVFNPSRRQGEKVAVKGILIEDANGIRINVTSLQSVATNCAQ
jgi:mono/diheme cytochrome c family protein